VISVVITGRRMQVSEMFMASRSRLALAHRHARAVCQQQMSVGDHRVTIVDTLLDHGLGAQQARNLDRLT